MLTARFDSGDRIMLLKWLALFAAVVAGLDYLGLDLTRLGPHVTTLWPAKGIVLAVLLFSDRKTTPFVLAAAATAGIAARLAFGDTLLLALPGTLINVGGAALTARALHALSGETIDFHDWRMLARFSLVSSIAAVAIAIPAASFANLVRGDDWTTSFTGWALATGLSYVIFVPPLVLLATRPREEMTARQRRIAAAVLGLTFVLLAIFSQTAFPISYIIPVSLVIVAVAAGIEATAIGLLLTAAIAVPMTLTGHGPAMLIHGPPELQMLAVQVFLVVLTMGLLPAAAAVSERDRLRKSLSGALAREQAAVLELTASEERYRLLAEQSKDIIVRSDKDGVIRYISPGCRAMGYEPEELIGVAGHLLVHPDDAEHLARNTARLMQGEKPDDETSREHRFRKKDGSYVWLQGNPTILYGENGEGREIINFFRDVSHHKAMDLALAEAMKKAEAAAIAKSEFLANMSHELRTPLTGVVGFSQLLTELPDLSATAKRYVSRVAQAAQGLLAVVNDILDFSKLEAGQIEIRPEPASPRQAALDVLALMLPQARAKNIRLEMTVSPAVPETLALDDGRVRQVLLNLVGNAVKFTPRGEVTLSLDYRDGRLRCAVRDTGPGIPADRIGLLFQRFSQLDTSAGRMHGGTGLGLAICKGLVDAMGGEIAVTSEEEHGSTFFFAIPAPEAESECAAAQPAGADDLAGLRVLAVDDNPQSLDLLENTLVPSGVALVTAPSGTDAIARAREQVFDVILMDLHMPEMSGSDAAAQIRAGGPNARTPIFAITADAVRGLKDDRNAHVFDGVLLKPLSLATLRRTLRETAKAA